MQLDRELRDELATIAERDFGGVPLGEALAQLVREYKINRIMRRYDELRADPDEWASYHNETRLTDNAAGDSLPTAVAEFPEYNA